MCVRFSQRGYMYACTCQVYGCCCRCVYIHEMFRIVAYLFFSNGTLVECRACLNVKKEDSSFVFLTHLAMLSGQHGVAARYVPNNSLGNGIWCAAQYWQNTSRKPNKVLSNSSMVIRFEVKVNICVT